MTSVRRSQRTVTFIASLGTLLVFALAGCSSNEKTQSTAKGGAKSTAGRSGTGDTKSSGGTTGTDETGGTSSADVGGTATTSGGTTTGSSSAPSGNGGTVSSSSASPTTNGGAPKSSSAPPDTNGGTVSGGGGGGVPSVPEAGAPAAGAPAIACESDITCKPNNMLCDIAAKRCVLCLSTNDCPDSQICAKSGASPRCVECEDNKDCDALGKTGQACAANKCQVACASDAECTDGLKCNTSVTPSFCAACAKNSDCPAEQYCAKGVCSPDICKPGVDKACLSASGTSSVVVCTADGDGFGSPVACPAGQPCRANGTQAACGNGGGGGAAGAGGGGGSAGGGSTLCSSGTGNPCTAIPKFTGTQTLDGKNDEFCEIPAFELSLSKNNGIFHKKDGVTAAVFTQRAFAQVAWSEAAFHAFVEVIGPAAMAYATEVGKIWDGESVELMITTAATLPATGHTMDDKNALHLQLNPTLAASIVSDGTGGNATPLTDPAQFVGKKTANGYVVEIKIPWPGAPTLAAAAPVRFDMAMNVDLSTIDATYPGRDAQIVLAPTNVSGANGCTENPPTPFCDERLWCTTALQ